MRELYAWVVISIICNLLPGNHRYIVRTSVVGGVGLNKVLADTMQKHPSQHGQERNPQRQEQGSHCLQWGQARSMPATVRGRSGSSSGAEQVGWGQKMRWGAMQLSTASCDTACHCRPVSRPSQHCGCGVALHSTSGHLSRARLLLRTAMLVAHCEF